MFSVSIKPFLLDPSTLIPLSLFKGTYNRASTSLIDETDWQYWEPVKNKPFLI